MDVRELSIPDSYVVEPQVHSDDRGAFWEWYRFDKLEQVIGRKLELAQANASNSARGVFRGIHFATLNPGQAKYVTCPSGEVLDFVVDIRVGSPTFGKWESVLLNEQNRKAVFLSEGLGHGFLALSPNATVNYLVNDVYRPSHEFGISPLDPELELMMPEHLQLQLSPKDREAPSLQDATSMNLLPQYEDALRLYRNQRSAGDK